MSSYYYFKTPCPSEKYGDFIINISHISAVRLLKNTKRNKTEYLICVDLLSTDTCGARYKTEEEARESLGKLLVAMGADSSLADTFVFESRIEDTFAEDIISSLKKQHDCEENN